MDGETPTDDTNHFTYPNLMRQNEKTEIVHQRSTFIQSETKKKNKKSTFVKFALNKNTWNTNLFFDVHCFFANISQFINFELILF